MRVLLVDDEVELVSALAERLDLRGIDAQYALSGEEALQQAQKTSYDLAVLDVKMPGIGGLALKERLEALRPDLKFIFMTGYGSDAVIEEIRQDRESNIYLVKPVAIEDLLEAMHKVLPAQKKEL